MKVSSSHAEVWAAFSAVEKASLSSLQPGRFLQLLFLADDSTVDEEPEEQCTTRHRKNFERVQSSFAFLRDELVSRACEEVEDFAEDVVGAAQTMVFLKGAMHEALEEHWRRRAVFLNGSDRTRIGSLVETDGEDFQRTGTHHAEPRGSLRLANRRRTVASDSASLFTSPLASTR